MKSIAASALNSYRRYRAAKARSKAYKVVRYCLTALFVAYLLTICFPQYLFAHKVTYNKFQVYSRASFDQGIYKILDDAEAKPAKSTIYALDVTSKRATLSVIRISRANNLQFWIVSRMEQIDLVSAMRQRSSRAKGDWK